MKKSIKILVALLSVAILACAFVFAIGAESGPVAAVGDATYGTLEEAIQEAPSDSTVKILSNTTVGDANINIGKNLTIDLNGKTVSSSVASLFVLTDSVRFNIVGEGEFNLTGMLFSTVSSAAPNVKVEGKANTKGITVNHTGESSIYIVSHGDGKYSYKNIDVMTTSIGTETASKDFAFFYATPTTDAATVSFDIVDFRAPNAKPANPGMFIISLGGKNSKLTITNSGLYTNASGIYLGYMKGESVDSEVVYIENSVISAVPKYSSSRNYAIFCEEAGWKHEGLIGTVTIVDSLVEAAGRTLYSEYKSIETITGKIVLKGSTVKTVGENGSDNAVVFSRWINVEADGTSRLATVGGDASFNTSSKVHGSVGTRTDIFKVTTNTKQGVAFPDGNMGSGTSDKYTWIYDPVGDPKYPYVIAEISGSKYIIGYDGETPVYAKTPAPNYHVNYSFDSLWVKPATDSEELYNLLVAANTNKGFTDTVETFWSTKDGMQMDIKAGSLYRGVINGNSYVKFVVTPDSKNNVHTIGADGTTVTLGTDPYFILGGNMNYNTNLAHVRDNGDFKRMRVVVLDLDIGCDNEIGYPQMNVQIQARYGTAASNSGNDIASLSPDGKFTYKGNMKDTTGSFYQLKPVGEWNHITVVFYTDPTFTVGSETDVGAAFYFFNGEAIGYSKAYNKGLDAYIMGMRFGVSASTENKIGASIAFDNISWKVYENYLYGESDGNISKDTAAKYVTATPAAKYINGGAYSVAGVNYTDINKAITAANANGTVVDLLRDVNDPQLVTVDGVVNANGHKFELADGSVACQPTYGEDGSISSYTFNSAFNGLELTYYWYQGEVGNLEQELDPKYFVTTKVGIGQIPSIDYKYPSFFDVTALKTKYHSGWSETGEGSGELAPLSLSTYAAYKDTGVYLYPTFEYTEDPWTYYIKDTKTGTVLEAGYTNSEAVNAYKKLSDGKTLVLTADMVLADAVYFYNDSYTSGSGTGRKVNGVSIDNAYTEAEINKMKETAQVLTVDLNGHMIKSTFGGRVATVSNNTIFNIYSSVPGGAVYSRSLSSTTVKGQRAIAIMHRSGTDNTAKGLDVFNAHVNIGAYTDPVTGAYYPGSNMYVASGVAIEGNNGDNSCSINVDGAGIYSTVSDSSGTVMTRYYAGSITVKNSVVAAPTRGAIIDMKSLGDTDVTPNVSFENCLLINNTSSRSNLIGSDGDVADGYLRFDNCQFANTLNSISTKTQLGEGNAAAYLRAGNFDSGLTNAYYYVGMTLDGFVPEGDYFLKVINPIYNSKVAGSVDDSNYIYVVNNGEYDRFVAEHPEVNAKYIRELPVLTKKLVKSSDTVSVVFEDENGGAFETLTFAKGGNTLAQTMANDGLDAVALDNSGVTLNLTTMTLTASGWDVVKNVQSNVSVKPKFDAALKFEGVKASVSLHIDFTINLYIPKSYESYIVSIFNGDAELEIKNAVVGEVEYLVVSVPMAAAEAADDAVFELNVTENGYNGKGIITESVVGYAETIINSAKPNFLDLKLANYMIAYANEAIKYFRGEENERIASLLTEVNNYEIGEALDTAPLAAAFDYAAITLDKSLSFALCVKEGFVGTVTVAGNEFAIPEGGTRLIVLDGLAFSAFADDVTIVATDAEGNEVVNCIYNLSTYVQYHMAAAESSSESADALDLIKAFYNYVNVAKNYAEQ